MAGIREQTRPADAVVVVDNGSSDNTSDLLRQYQREWPDLRVVRQRNVGQLGGWRAGLIALDDVDVVVLLDGDDWYEPGYLERVAAEFRAYPAVEIVHSSYRMHPLEEYGVQAVADQWIEGDFLRALFQLHWVGSPTSMVALRRGTLDFLIGTSRPIHPAEFRQRTDDLIAFGGSVYALRRRFMSDPLVNYRVHGSNQLAGRPIIPWAEQLPRNLALLRLLEPTRRFFASLTPGERRILVEQEVRAIQRGNPDPWTAVDSLLQALPVSVDELGDLALIVDELLKSG